MAIALEERISGVLDARMLEQPRGGGRGHAFAKNLARDVVPSASLPKAAGRRENVVAQRFFKVFEVGVGFLIAKMFDGFFSGHGSAGEDRLANERRAVRQ